MLGKIEGKRRRGQEKMTIEWHHQYNVQELMQTLGDGKGQGGLACCSPWGHEESEHALATEPQGSSMRQSRQQNKDENNKGGHYITIKGSTDQEDVLCCTKLLQLCLTLWDPVDHSLPGSSVHRILQARILEWVAVPFSRGSSQARDRTRISYVSCTGRQVLYH